ncbi:MAG: nicotinic acid mononucleotide adenylyltransferase [Bacillota bacterium]|nr:nicotinic acid mononucleotide adenylyltransferase [Bacillota bacterium]
MAKKRFGIMGGTFDPIHLGHLVIANEVLNIYNMDKIIFIPAGNPPFKNITGASSFDRYLMTIIATMANNNFEVSDIEIKNKEKSYTINTVKELIKIYDDTEFYFITGMDAIIDLPKWQEPQELLKHLKFIAVNRPGVCDQDALNKIEEIREIFDGKIEILKVPMLQISSTDIRDRIKNNKSIKYLVSESVEQYIIKNNLYTV